MKRLNDDRCVCCGEIIPEGRWVCPQCEKDTRHPYFNKSGCADPTAYEAMRNVQHDEAVRRVNRLIKELKNTISDRGFVLLNRIELKDIASGIVFK